MLNKLPQLHGSFLSKQICDRGEMRLLWLVHLANRLLLCIMQLLRLAPSYRKRVPPLILCISYNVNTLLMSKSIVQSTFIMGYCPSRKMHVLNHGMEMHAVSCISKVTYLMHSLSFPYSDVIISCIIKIICQGQTNNLWSTLWRMISISPSSTSLIYVAIFHYQMHMVFISFIWLFKGLICV
jgi:hypothetical protein